MGDLMLWEFLCLTIPVYALGVLAGWRIRTARPRKDKPEGDAE